MKRAELKRLYERVYRTAQAHLSPLCAGLIQTLEAFGAASETEVFANGLMRLAARVAQAPQDDPMFAQFHLFGASADTYRAYLVESMLWGMGADRDRSTAWFAETLLRSKVEIRVRLAPSGPKIYQEVVRPPGDSASDLRFTRAMVVVHGRARALHRRLKQRRIEIHRSFRGTDADPTVGLFQVLDLLSEFPDVTEAVYAAAGVPGLVGVPPQAKAGQTLDERGKALLQGSRLWETRRQVVAYGTTAGLVAAGIVATVLTAGTMGPLAALCVGTTLAVGEGATRSALARRQLTRARDAHRFGAGAEKTVAFHQNELLGAMGGLAVNVLTAGFTARLGASAALSALVRSRVALLAIGTGEGALTSAVNPNVWESDNTAGIILIGALTGYAGAVIGGRLLAGANTAFKLGTRVFVGVPHNDSPVPLSPGSKVVVTSEQLPNPVNGTVRRVERSSVIVDTPRGPVTVSVDQATRVGVDMFSSNFTGDPRVSPRADPPDFDKLAKAMGKNWHSSDVRALHETGGSADYGFAPFGPQGSGYFMGQLRHEQAHSATRPRLVVRPAKSQDWNSAFRKGKPEWRPDYDEFMTTQVGKKAPPNPNEVARFSAHGSPWGFSGLTTRQAAREMADVLVDVSRHGQSSLRIRYVALDSCSQGNRRFLLVGPTNAQVFQRELNARLGELGIDPTGPKGITVLACDQPGLTYGMGRVGAFVRIRSGRWVPADQQNARRHPLSIVNAARTDPFCVIVGIVGTRALWAALPAEYSVVPRKKLVNQVFEMGKEAWALVLEQMPPDEARRAGELVDRAKGHIEGVRELVDRARGRQE